jgi:flagellar basal-body rod protein FlgC
MNMMRLVPGADTTASALNAERIKLESISQNIANANVTDAPGGGPYQRKEVVFESIINEALSSGSGKGANPSSVKAIITTDSNNDGPKIYDPEHPHADDTGYVQMPNVNIHEEMVNMILASRSYEANLAAMKYGRRMATQTLSIGR